MGKFSEKSPEKQGAGRALGAIGAAICMAVTITMLVFMFFNLGGPSGVSSAGDSEVGIMDYYDRSLSNAVSDALNGVLSIEKVYWLVDSDPVAPIPDPNCAGQTDDPATLRWLLDEAEEKLGLTDTLFTVDTPILEGSVVRYYLDDTIFSVSWKQPVGGAVYSFAEVKIAHSSQFRRFLAGGEYGTGILYTPSQMAKSVNAVTASSADYYSYRPMGTTVYNGEVCRAVGGYLDVCYIDDRGDLIFANQRDAKSVADVEQLVKEKNIRFSLCFGPILIEQGQDVTPGYYDLGQIDGLYSRCALCQQGQLHYVVVNSNMEGDYLKNPTITEFSRHLVDLGIQKAYAMDGGQTAVLYANEEIVNVVDYGNERNVSDIIYFATAMGSN